MLHQGRFRLVIRKYFTGSEVKHFNRLPRAVLKSPFLEGFKKQINFVLRDRG